MNRLVLIVIASVLSEYKRLFYFTEIGVCVNIEETSKDR
jgi:hypothetical protein